MLKKIRNNMTDIVVMIVALPLLVILLALCGGNWGPGNEDY